MKLKRTKLAALALTALMAVGATSLVAYAGETDTPATAATVNELAKDSSGEYDVTWSYDSTTYDESTNSYGTATVTYKVNKDSTTVTYKNITATVTLESKAACKQDAIVMASYTVTEVTPSITLTKNFTVSGSALEHDYQWVTVKTTDATCTTEGTYTEEYTCSKCGDVDTSLTRVSISSAALGHVYDETKAEKIVKGTNTTVSSDGTVTLDDPSLPGTYIIQKYCTREAKYVDYKTVNVPATTAATFAISWKSVETDGNIVSIDGVTNGAAYDFYKYSSIVGGIELNDIELTNCAKAGKYVITLYDGDGNVFSTETVDVAAHDKTIVLVEFDSADDAADCTVTYKADGTYSIKNTNCSGSITYYEVTYCVASNHTTTKTSGKKSLPTANVTYATGNNFASYTSLSYLSTSSKMTVEGTGNHVIDKDTKDKVESIMTGKNLTYVADFYPLTQDSTYSKYVTFTNTSTCTTAGTVTVNYICKVCGAVAGTDTVDVVACGHDFENVTAVTENMKAATCSSTGSFESVIYCAHKDIVGCTAEESRTTVLIPRTKHTNETKVAANGTGTDDNYDTLEADNITIKFSGSIVVDPADGSYLTKKSTDDIAEYATNATGEYQYLCHVGNYDYPSSLGVYAYAVSTCENCGGNAVKIYKPVTITITSITKEKTNGEAGSITLKAVYTRKNTDGTTSTFSDTATFDYFSTLAAYQGRTVTTLSGLNLDSDGVYRYYVNNAVATTYTGFVEYNSATFFVANGVLCNTINGLAEYNGTFYYLANGQLQDQYTGLVEYDGEWFYIKNGVLDTVVNGIVEYNGGSFLVAAGRLVQEYSGLYQDFDGTWYFLANGQVQTQFTGVTYYDGAFFKLVSGVLDSTFNGTVEYDGATFNVVAGQLYDQVA